MNFLLDADDDWQEGISSKVYPAIHPYLERIGKVIGVPLYATGKVHNSQIVGGVDIDEEKLEEKLVNMGFYRNPVSCFKSLEDGRKQEGTWALWPEYDDTGLVEDGMQVHVTLFSRKGDTPGRELYAHYEDDWRKSPVKHLREKNFDIETGVEITTELLDKHGINYER